MKIPARNLPPYLDTIKFPVQILTDDGASVDETVDRLYRLCQLIEGNEIIGIGSWSRIRYFQRIKDPEPKPIATPLSIQNYSGTRYSFNEALPSGHHVWQLKLITKDHDAVLNGATRGIIRRAEA